MQRCHFSDAGKRARPALHIILSVVLMRCSFPSVPPHIRFRRGCAPRRAVTKPGGVPDPRLLWWARCLTLPSSGRLTHGSLLAHSTLVTIALEAGMGYRMPLYAPRWAWSECCYDPHLSDNWKA
ncbi:hypothetical protein GWK47_009475 [Chionoecetes opilio]|uniref:Uncharacterized protein n=1 Tax=Chionoecetes opilio TaxID=41210 RepID=A0A8J5CN59_CHIOP|nr:hypothetical protein GWK47_009475 [Chionoecetes opilio]